MEVTDLTKWIRVELGKLSTDIDIADEDIEHEAGHIIQRLNDKLTVHILREIIVSYGVSDYAVDPNTIRVQEVFSNDDIEEMRIRLGSYIVSEAASSEDYNFPSLWAIKMMRRRRGLPRIWFQYNPIERILKISPTPRLDQVPYWYMSIERPAWTLDDIPEEFEELVLEGTKYKCLEIVALRRSTEGGIIREGGRVDYPADKLFAIAKQVQKEFEDVLDIKVKIWTI